MHKIKRTGEILLNITERDDPHHIDNIDHSDTKNGKVESGLPLSGIGNDKAEKKADRSDPVAAIHDLHSGCSRNTEHPSAQEDLLAEEGEDACTHRCHVIRKRTFVEACRQHPEVIDDL